jgi:crotonobetainyl-CoA:carnitine CoA-transferase CaiB-like acyl-CoA transferase
MPKKPLDGIRVVDFTWVLTGPIITKTLAHYGAEVIKIESRSRPDLFRISGPFKDGVPGVNRGGRFNWTSDGKMSICLNLAHPRGLKVVKRLIAHSDIVVDNYSGGSMERMGLGYEELKKVKPDIIMLSTCMQGQTGPHAAHPGFGNQLTALSGFDYITGWPDREPVPLGAYTDNIAPHFNIVLILAALDYRRRTGKGQYFDLSQYEAGVHFMAPLVMDCAVNGRVDKRMGNRCFYAAPHGAYRCRSEDRWCAIGVFSDDEWAGFCRVIGDPEWARDPRFATLLGRKENEDELDKLVEEWTVKYRAEEVMALMQAAGVGAGVVRTVQEVLEEDPQLKYRQSHWVLEHPEVGKYFVPGPLFRLSKVTYDMRRAPLLGEHNEYILKDILKMSDDEIAELIIEGAVE